jgi:hypothetical protein
MSLCPRYVTESAKNQICYMTVSSINVYMAHSKPASEHQPHWIMADIAEPASLAQAVH